MPNKGGPISDPSPSQRDLEEAIQQRHNRNDRPHVR
jgi:hypothetical protein